MFEVRCLQDGIKPLFFVSMILGLGSPHHGEKRTIFLIVHYLYNSAIFLFLCFSCFILTKPFIEFYSFRESDAVAKVIFTLATYATPLTAMFTSLWVHKNRSHESLRSIEELDYLLIKNPLHHYWHVRNIVLTIIVSSTLWVIAEVVVFVKDNWNILILFYVAYYINMIVATTSTVMVSLLYVRFKKLNEELSTFGYQYTKALDIKRDGLQRIGKEIHIYKNEQHYKPNKSFLKINLHKARVCYDDRIDTLKCLRRSHRHLVKLTESINSNHGILFMILILEAVICTVVAIFMIYEAVKFRMSGLILGLVSALVRSLLKASAISFACEWTSNEARRTGAILQDLILEEEEMAPSFQLFAEQLKHTRVQFSACGFFPMGASAMSGVIASAATYTIILIQFVLNESSDNTNKSTLTDIEI